MKDNNGSWEGVTNPKGKFCKVEMLKSGLARFFVFASNEELSHHQGKRVGPRINEGAAGLDRPRKQRRYRPGTVALREIRRYQKSTDLLIRYVNWLPVYHI